MNIACMRVSYPWMGGHSGYDCLVDQLQTANHAHAFHSFHKPQQQLGYLSRRLISRAYHRSRGSEFYSREHAHAERSMMRWAKHNSCDLAFYCHADEGFGLAGTRPIPENPALVGTFHQPPSWWREEHRRHDYLTRFTRLLTMSTAQLAFFETFAPGRARFIPHGVDTGFFLPGDPASGDHPRFLLVGHWLRDFETLAGIVAETLHRQPGVRFDLVVPQHRWNEAPFQRLTSHEQVHLHAGLSDLDLRSLYQSATALVMPLHDCTANNAIVEAMACGCPIVATDLPGVRDYTTPDFATLLPPGDTRAWADALLRLAADPALTARQGAAARQHAVTRLDWSLIAAQTMTVLTEAAQTAPSSS